MKQSGGDETDIVVIDMLDRDAGCFEAGTLPECQRGGEFYWDETNQSSPNFHEHLAAAKAIGDFVNRHPSIKMLALSFLILVGVVLMGDGLGQHIQKGYIYFAMAFSFGVEVLNIRARAKRKKAQQPVELRQQY